MYEDTGSQPPPSFEGPSGPWDGRVSFSQTSEGYTFAYRPHEVITSRGPEALEIALKLFADLAREEDDERGEVPTIAGEIGPFTLLIGVSDPLLLIEELRAHNIVAQPNHVFFAHGVTGNPLWPSSVTGNPLWPSSVTGNPLWPSAAGGDPPGGVPTYGYGLVGGVVASRHPFKPDRSTALPPPRHTHTEALKARIGTGEVPGSPHVVVLDTGLAAPFYRPAWLGNGIKAAGPKDIDWPTYDNDGYLCPSAGHGTFIAGVVAQIAPGCDITLHRVLSDFDDGDEWTISHVIGDLVTPDPERTILNCSFGGYVLEHPHLMAWTIRKIQHRKVQVVASAGNDATFRPAFPAALPDVIAVGALGPSGPAWFTNFGAWVDACAPGTNLLSCFFDNFNGPAPVGPYGDDPDDFKGFAVWSGTSFAAPVVVGNLARMMMDGAATTRHAIARVINAEALTIIAYLGTVVDAM